MSRRKRPQAVVICEDKAQFDFVLGFLEPKGFNRLTPLIHKKGSGDAKRWVREKYARELKAYRSKSTYMGLILIAVADCDTDSIESRKVSIDCWVKTVTSGGQRKAGERVAIIVPKRNIETWFNYLDHGVDDEEFDFKQRYKDAKRSKYGKRMAMHCAEIGSVANLPPSLADACEELSRLGI